MRSFFGWLWNTVLSFGRWFRGVAWPWYRGQSRRMQIIVGSVTLLGICACCGIAGAMNGTSTTSTTAVNQQQQPGTSATQAPVSTTAPAKATAKPRPTATHAPVATQPVSHPPTATTPPAPKYPAINSNPWDYTFTNTGHLLYQPVGSFCDGTYFTCVSTFWKDTKGFVIQCGNGEFSHSGGVQGVCSRDGGPGSAVYQP